MKHAKTKEGQPLPMSMGEAIKQIRKERGYTQIEVAEEAGIAVNSLRLYEAGKRVPKIEQLRKIAEILHVGVVELFPDDLAERPRLVEGISTDRFKEYAQAEKDGRLVVLPCKAGNTLYSITCGEIKPFVVAGFEMYDKDLIAVEQIKLGRELRVVGKTAFLTREEAEAAISKENSNWYDHIKRKK